MDERRGAFYAELPTGSGEVQPVQFPGVRVVGGFAIPSWVDPDSDVQVSTCRGCGASIAWTITKKGKRAPVDRDGTNHFATCPKAEIFRKK